jgi:NAD(P)H-nitrite reductase large subunit
MARFEVSKQPLKGQHIGGGKALIGGNGDIVCYCNDLFAADVEKTIRANGLTRVEEITARTHKDAPCGLCRKRIASLLERVIGTGLRSEQAYF